MFGRKLINIPVLFVSLALMILGYKWLGTGPVDSKESLVYAPAVLVLVYAVLMPLSVLLKWDKE